MTVMLVKIRGLEKDITDPWMTPLRPLLENVKILLCLALKFIASLLSTKTIKKCPNLWTRPAQRVLDASLPLETTRVLSAKVIFDY